MDFVAVPAGTARVAALALRGADPSLSFATADSFNTTLGDTLCAVAGAAGRMEAAYSNVAAELVGALFTNDATVLDSATILSVIDPAKLRAVWLRLVADGLDDAASLSGSRFRYERDNVLAGLDHAALAVGYLVTAADLFLTQASAGALGGAATLWVRSATIRAFASPVRGQPGLYSLAPLADLYRFAPGIFHTATRDLVDSPFRLVMEESQRRAQDARMPYAALASASPLNTARAAAQAFIATAPPGRNWELYGPNGTPGDLTRRSQDWSDRCSLAGAIGAGGGGHAFLEVVCRRFDELTLSLPSLHTVLEGLLSVQAITTELAALAAGCFKPARGLPDNIQDLLAIEAACLELLSPMEEHNLLTARQRVEWICSMQQDTHARGGGGGGASAGSSDTIDHSILQRVKAALSTPAARTFFAELRALLDAVPPNSLTISKKLTSSPLAFVRRMGAGVAPPSSCSSSLWRDEFDRASMHVLKDKWRYNLSMRLAADKQGKVKQTAEKWRTSPITATAIAEFRFDEIDWFGLTYEVRGVQADTDFMLLPIELHYSETDHFVSLGMVVQRIETALSLDSLATNSLTSAVDRAKTFFQDHCTSELTRADDIETIQTYFKELWSSVREEWFPVISGRAPLQAFPDVVVPRSSSCWGTLDEAEKDGVATKALLRNKALAHKLGLDTTRVSYPAGMARPGTAGSSRAGRSRSPSPSGGRASPSSRRDDSGGVSRATRSPTLGGGGDGPPMAVFWRNQTDFAYSSSGTTVVPAHAAAALGVKPSKFCWPVVASLKQTAAQRRKFCPTPDHARCISGEAHEQSDRMRAHFTKVFGGKRKQDFERGRDLDGPDRDHTSTAKAAKLASDLEAEMLSVVPAGWPPALQLGGLGARMSFDHPSIIPGYRSDPEHDGAGDLGDLDAAAATMLSLGAGSGDGAPPRGGDKGGKGRGAKGGGKAIGAKGGGKATGGSAKEGAGKGKGGKGADRGGGAKGRGGGRGKGGGKGGGKGRGRGALVTFASGAAGGAWSGADASDPGGGSTSHSGGRETQFQLSVGAARCHRSSSHAAGTPVNSADITGITSAWGSYGAPLDAGNRSDASSSRELSFSDVQHQQGADDFCAYYGLSRSPSMNELDPSTVGCVRPRLCIAAAALGSVAAPRTAARAAVPILLAPLALSSKIILYVLAISATTAPALLLPAGGGVWGREAPRTFLGAAAMKGASSAASRWAPALLEGQPRGLTAHYVAAQRLSPGDSSSPTNWLAVCLVRPGLAGAPGTIWKELSELEGTPEHAIAAVAAYRGHSLLYDLPALASLEPIFTGAERDVVDRALGAGGGFEVGKRAAMPPLPGPSQGFERETRSFDEMWAVHRSEVAVLRGVFSEPGPTLTALEAGRLACPLAAGFGTTGSEGVGELAAAFDVIWAADCPAWHERIAEADPAQVPLSLRETGALASFRDEALALTPFASRCRPPWTVRRPPPAPQLPGPPGPRDFEGFYPPGHFRAKADPWLFAQRAYLLDALEHGEACTAKPPEVLIFSDHERLPEYRGRLYEYDAAHGEYALTDTAAPATTHLNLPFAVHFSGGYPDQEIFSTLEFGVDFDADNLEMQVVLPRHLESLAGGLAKIQTDIAVRAGRGWYEIFDCLPRNPWRPQQVGTRPKPNGKRRVIINASFPHGELADDYGVRVHALNVLSKRSYDSIRGSDGKRMFRLLDKIRVTACSPPPPQAGDGAVAPLASAARFSLRLGKVRVEQADASATHPWSVHGGLGSLLGTPFLARGAEQQEIACDAYDLLHANPNRSAFTIAAEFGLKCSASQARVSARARASYESVLAAGVARGRSLQLVGRGRPGRSHLDSVAARVIAKARLLNDAQRVSQAAVGTASKLVLHLFASSDELASELQHHGVGCTTAGIHGDAELRDDVTYQHVMAQAGAGVYTMVVAGNKPVGDDVTRRVVAIIVAACRRGASFILESPADRVGAIPELESQTNSRKAHFDWCRLGSESRQATIMLYSAGLTRLDSLAGLRCRCPGRHGHQAASHEVEDRAWSRPHELTMLIAAAAADWARRAQARVTWTVGLALNPCERVLAQSDDGAKRPPELKWYISEYMSDDAVLKHISIIVGTFVVTLSDDFNDWFYQLKLMAGCYWMVGYILLELEKLASEVPELRYIVEKVLGQGTVPGSNWGQRLCELVLHMWDTVFEVLDGSHTAAQRLNSPGLDGWFARREAAGLASRLHSRGGYTDDTKFRFVGPERARRGAKAWCFVTKGFRTIMADASKRMLGVHDISLGTCFNYSLGIAFVGEDKLKRALAQLLSLARGELAASIYRSLVGLLLHLAFLAGMRPSATHGMFTPMMEGGALAQGPDTLVAGRHLTPAIMARASEWTERLSRSSGAPFTSAVASLARVAQAGPGAARHFWRSDACKEGTDHPGIAGICTGRGNPRVWVRRLTGDELLLPVPVTEFAGFFGNCSLWGDAVPADELVVSEVDALVPAFVLTREASASPLMQHVLAAVNALECMARLREHMTIGHISSEVNVTADLPSRGRISELLSIAEHAGAYLTVEPHPGALDVLLSELVQLELNRRPATALGSHNICMDGRPLAHVERVPACADMPISPAISPAAPGPQRHIASGERPSPYTRPRVERHVPAAAVSTVGHQHTVATVDLPERTVTTTQLEALHDFRVQHCAAVVEREADVLDLMLPERTALKRLLGDTSRYALKPAAASRLAHMCGAVHDVAWDNAGSKAKLDSNMRLWRTYCEGLNTPCWRPGEADLTAQEREREAILAANFLPYALTVMRGRRGCAQAKPASAYKAYLGVRKAHSKRTVELPSTKLVWQMCKRLNAKHLNEFGAQSLIVKRKQPFTKEILHALLSSTDKGALDLTVPAVAAAFRAFVATLRQTGMRKSELALAAGVAFTHALATRSHLQWCLRGIIYADPPPDLLRHPRVGDYAILIPPPSKADPYGEVWGALPIYLHHSPTDPDAAFGHLATLELTVPAVGQQRRMVPLISADNKRPLATGQLDSMLQLILRRLIGKVNASKYSWHSARIYLACSLLAAGASHAQIQALCRWQTEDSLRVYARLNPSSYDKLLSRAASAQVESVSVGSLPPLSSELAIRQLLGLSLVDALAAGA
jgi:hypothetical protein